MYALVNQPTDRPIDMQPLSDTVHPTEIPSPPTAGAAAGGRAQPAWQLQGRGGGGAGDYGRREERSKRQLRVARVLQSTIADVIRRCVWFGHRGLVIWVCSHRVGSGPRWLVVGGYEWAHSYTRHTHTHTRTRRGYPIKTKDILDDRIRAKISVVVCLSGLFD